jgi:hypothetical protein
VTWAPDYATTDLVRRYLGIENNADSVDTFIGLWITAVSANINSHCGRQFGKVSALEERYYEPEYDRRDRCWYAVIDDLQDTTGMTVVDDDGNTVTGYTLLPRNAPQTGRPYERMKLTTATGEIAPTALWGWNAVPSAVSVGLLLQAARLNARRDSPFGIAGSPSEGSELRLLAQLDPDFRTTLAPWRRKWWAA